MSKFEKNMEEIFDITRTHEEVLPVEIKKPTTSNTSDLEEDLNDAYQQSKDNLQNIISQGQDAMDTILEIAKDSQHPRAFEVYGTILKNLVDANKELLAIQKQMRTMDGKQKESNKTTIDKAIFVGSTADLGKLLKDNGHK